MFAKLSAIEKSRFYAAIAELENHYGKKSVQEGLESMDAILEKRAVSAPPVTLTKIRAAIEKDGTEQLTLLPDETDRTGYQRTVKERAPYGANKKKMQTWAAHYIERFPRFDNMQEILIKLYYVDGLNQYQIADKVGVNQRAISEVMSGVSGERKQRIIKKWKVGMIEDGNK